MEALAVLKTAVKSHPELSSAHLILAQWLSNGNEPAKARTVLQRAIVDEPGAAVPYLLLGKMALAGQSFAEAGLLLERALALAPSEKDPAKQKDLVEQARMGLAALAELRKDWPAAQKQLDAVVADNPKHAGALQALGRVLFHEKKYDESLRRLREAAEADKNLVRGEAAIAGLYQEEGDITTASKWMVEAIKADPKDARTRLAAATWSLDIGELEQASQQADGAIAIAPDSLQVQARMVRGTVALFGKDYATAEKFFQDAHLRAPANLAAMKDLALALCAQKDPVKKGIGFEYAQIQAQLLPRDPEAQAALGWAYYQLGRLDQAEQVLQKAASLGNLSADAVYYYLRVLVAKGHMDEAKKLARTLKSALKEHTVFAQRPEAEALVKQIGD